jgi:hypothetical protein
MTTVTGKVTVGRIAYPVSATVALPAPTVVRSPYAWPFSWDSIWNMPISASATYAATGISVTYDYSTEGYAVENNCTDPNQPVKTLTNSHNGTISVHCDPRMSGAGQWNDTFALLRTDGDSAAQGQTLQLQPGGNPNVGGVGGYTVPDVSITTSQGITGAHGGSSLSCLGGTLTLADLTGAGVISHACKVLFNGLMFYSQRGFQWPAGNADGGFDQPGNVNYYGGSNPLIVEGALLALPPSINPLTRYTDPLIRRIATALQNFGCYIVDNTASGPGNATAVIEMNWDAAPAFKGGPTFNADLLRMYEDLQVISNSTEATPGGGALGTRRLAPFAPPFTAAPKIGTLTDDFTVNRLATVWGRSAGVTWSPGQAAVKCDAGYDSYLQPPGVYDLTGSGICAKVSPYLAPGAATSILLGVSTGNEVLLGYAGGTLAVNRNIGGTQTTLFTTAYSPAAHAWWRVRETGSIVFFDTSPDGATWTTRYSCADYVLGFPLTSLGVTFQAGVYSGGTGGISYVRAVNTAAAVSPPSPSPR